MTDKPARPTAAKKPKRASAPKKPAVKSSPAATKTAKPVVAKPAAIAPQTPVTPAPPRPAPAPSVAPRSVSEQIGGTTGVASLSDKVSALLIGDPRVNHALFGTPRPDVIEKVKSLLSVAIEEAEEDLHALFAPLREKGFKEGQFAHLLTHVKAATQELGHPEELGRKIATATEKACKKVFGH